ncbi:MAG: UDP-glucose/GDP-mannose dehydrogenase family protein [Candidatus Krumholzibacteria bacterium]|jgi:GDP-mannose 6-dehydrogenase|nr:UDP-glucose/GDP-mannose dehydrogenase family protein [Candidatus Krumholzibacteria bacterium]MDP6670139.1 UDP-glucose/GDP-mannose dehydrogenase family protein [Candidatus Krumholzibacteria bacterium]MDP7021477.1 UDP-glucose/GDP-mannose dehydrogenase family protein [Candidatus Krumholzibacteria bacterium]
MRISVFGLGYVGAVSAACLAKEGHELIGVDPVETKVSLINEGKTPIIEDQVGEIIAETVASGSLRATMDASEGIANSELSLICVGTPSREGGSLDLHFVERVCETIGRELASKEDRHVVVIRSTILPGTMRGLVIPTLEKHSGKKAGKDFGVCNNPEFLREGSAVYDFYNPPKTVIGESDNQSGDLLSSLYEKMDAPLIRTRIESAEMVKYVDNIWHALKVAFGNEIGNICKKLDIDGHEVMDIFVQDTKLNISPNYLKPGFAFGGSCLPKDLRAMNSMARDLVLELPILTAILPSNQLQVERGLLMILEKDRKKIGFLGFSFKAGTDDLRESPIIELIERLIGKGYDLALYDRNVNVARLVGANRDFIEERIPHISRLMVGSMEEVLEHAEVLVLGNADPEFRDVHSRLGQEQILVDLVRLGDPPDAENYDGICW